MTKPLDVAARRRLLSMIEGLPLPSTLSALALSLADGPLAGELGARGYRVADRVDSRAASRDSTDLVVVVGFLEHQSWDRWALQQVHALLRSEGVLVLVVPNTLSPASLADPRYLGAKVSKQLRKLLLARGLAAPPATPRTGPKTYTRGQLGAMLETLGFELERWSGVGPLGIPVPPALATHHLVWCRKKPSIFGLDPKRPFPDPARHRQRFEEVHRPLVRVRDEWERSHPMREDRGPQAIVPERYRGENVLVLAPHPDDEIIGCGGTLLRLVAAGARVVVLQATDGSASAALAEAREEVRRNLRLAEAESVSRAAGFARTILWREDNRSFVHKPERVAMLRATLAELGPALIFTPFVTDIHEDHRTLNRMLAEALEDPQRPDLEVLNYEVWSLAPANRHCDVAEVMPRLEELLFLYETAMKVDDFVHLCVDRNYYNSCLRAGHPGFAEAFLSVSPQTFRRIAGGA